MSNRLLDERPSTAQDVLNAHELAERYPPDRDERLDLLKLAHEIYLSIGRRRGRPKKDKDHEPDHLALSLMVWISETTGNTNARWLAEEVNEEKNEIGWVKKQGALATRIGRLARKFHKFRKSPQGQAIAEGCRKNRPNLSTRTLL